MPNLKQITCFLFDNGSLRAASTRALRRVSERLGERIGMEVRSVSLLHSNRVDPNELAGEPAQLLEESLDQFAHKGDGTAVILPLFFGPSGALVEYLPPRLAALQTKYPQCRFILANCLESPGDDSTKLLACAIERAIGEAIVQNGMTAPAIVMTDHGSPLVAVTDVRNRIGEELALRIPLALSVASMERREGERYAFNEPLLKRALNELAQSGQTEAVVALQFLFAGRHAGPKGDIAQICADVSREYPQLRINITEPIGESGEIIELLARRFNAAIS